MNGKDSTPRRQLSLLDTTSMIVGIIIGVGIYKTTPDVARCFSSAWAVPAIWILGGFLCLCGALCYAELASAYPHEGGDYIYMNRAYGPWAGFLFGWAQLTIVRPGDIAVMAFAFAAYGQSIWEPAAAGGDEGAASTIQTIYAVAAVLVLTLINIIGVSQGKWAQNLLTFVKVGGVLAIVAVAFLGPAGETVPPATAAPAETLPVSLAMIFVLFTFGGWNEMAYVSGEVRNPDRNILRVLLLGTCAVTVIYVLLNLAFLYALGHEGMARSDAVAYDVVSGTFPEIGGKLISALICISALGAVNGLIFTGSRISYAIGKDHPPFRLLGRWHSRTGTPLWALAVQGGIAVTLIVILGSFTEALLYTASAVYAFYLATTLAVVILRRKEPEARRPYRVTAYPVPIIIFALSCAFLIYSAVTYKPLTAAAAAGLLVAGVPVYWLSRRLSKLPPTPPDQTGDTP